MISATYCIKPSCTAQKQTAYLNGCYRVFDTREICAMDIIGSEGRCGY